MGMVLLEVDCDCSGPGPLASIMSGRVAGCVDWDCCVGGEGSLVVFACVFSEVGIAETAEEMDFVEVLVSAHLSTPQSGHVAQNQRKKIGRNVESCNTLHS